MPSSHSDAVSADVEAAVAWCRVAVFYPRKKRHPGAAAFEEAEQLGLLAHDPVWRATVAGETLLRERGWNLEPLKSPGVVRGRQYRSVF